jgi:hypothetical protein
MTSPSEARRLAEKYEERAAIMEFDGGLPRAIAEARAWAETYDPPTASAPPRPQSKPASPPSEASE